MSSASDPYTLFVYALNSPVSRERYTTRLRWFFSHIGLSDGTIEERCRAFVDMARKDGNWVLHSLLKFLNLYKERFDTREVTGATIRNYMKAVKLFCEMNDIFLPWKKITRGLPKGRRWVDDRAPTLEEIRKVIEYPDRRIRPIVFTMASSGIRVGAWDYLKVGHISPLIKDGKLVAAKMIVYAGEEEQYSTFISPEAYNSIRDWLEYRRRSGENLTSESWLLRNLWDSRVAKGRGFASVPVRLKSSGVKALMENALWTQGLRTRLPSGKRRHQVGAYYSGAPLSHYISQMPKGFALNQITTLFLFALHSLWQEGLCHILDLRRPLGAYRFPPPKRGIVIEGIASVPLVPRLAPVGNRIRSSSLTGCRLPRAKLYAMS